jgi:hypothetical protein
MVALLFFLTTTSLLAQDTLSASTVNVDYAILVYVPNSLAVYYIKGDVEYLSSKLGLMDVSSDEGFYDVIIRAFKYLNGKGYSLNSANMAGFNFRNQSREYIFSKKK